MMIGSLRQLGQTYESHREVAQEVPDKTTAKYILWDQAVGTQLMLRTTEAGSTCSRKCTKTDSPPSCSRTLGYHSTNNRCHSRLLNLASGKPQEDIQWQGFDLKVLVLCPQAHVWPVGFCCYLRKAKSWQKHNSFSLREASSSIHSQYVIEIRRCYLCNST